MTPLPRPVRALVACALALTACRAPETAPPAMDTPPDTALLSAHAVTLAGFGVDTVRTVPWRESYAVPARLVLDPMTTQPLGAFAEGRVTRVLVQPGDQVRAGDVLVLIHSHEMMDARAALSRAEAGQSAAEVSARAAIAAGARAERLFAAKALSQAELERARAAAAEGEAELARAKAERERATALLQHLAGSGPAAGADDHEVVVRAPASGTVITRHVQAGAVVLVGQPLVTLGRVDGLMLLLNVPEQALGAARTGAEVHFSVPAYAGATFVARVTRVAPAVDSLTRTVEVWAAVADPSRRLRAEMFANASLMGPAETPAVVVPTGAVQALEGDTVVVVTEQRGEGMFLRALPVRVGRRTAEAAEILAGVDPGTAVIVRGAALAKAELLKRRSAAGG
ncbi:MAG: efflux RND transporter periplasmic adaptor subunit [Gemmatimonadetes bacterium]|nr:efflux RND transporter periplasmic adaptor subunit [Gemmatimonadota bacterium]